jgi:rod shape-determining protein MreD
VLADVRFRLPLLLVVALVLHMTLFAQLRIFGVMPDLMLLIAIAAGLAGGPTYGAVMGFVAGMLSDVLLPTPMGLSALVFTFVGYIVGVTKGGLLKAAWWFPVLVASVASAAGVALFALAGSTLGQPNLLNAHLVAVIVVVSIVNGILIMPVLRAMHWALARLPARVLAE